MYFSATKARHLVLSLSPSYGFIEEECAQKTSNLCKTSLTFRTPKCHHILFSSPLITYRKPWWSFFLQNLAAFVEQIFSLQSSEVYSTKSKSLYSTKSKSLRSLASVEAHRSQFSFRSNFELSLNYDSVSPELKSWSMCKCNGLVGARWLTFAFLLLSFYKLLLTANISLRLALSNSIVSPVLLHSAAYWNYLKAIK